jgi:hypothetical protein
MLFKRCLLDSKTESRRSDHGGMVFETSGQSVGIYRETTLSSGLGAKSLQLKREPESFWRAVGEVKHTTV